jgi:minor extracellular protease Epr
MKNHRCTLTYTLTYTLASSFSYIRTFTLGMGLMVISLTSHAQLLGQDIISMDQLDLFTLPIELPQAVPQVDLANQAKAILETGEEALIEEIPDANTLINDVEELTIIGKNQKSVLTEVNVQFGWQALKQEWLLLLSAQQVMQLKSLPITVIEENYLAELQMLTVRIHVAQQYDNLAALTKLLAPVGAKVIERHHVYAIQGSDDKAESMNSQPEVNIQQPASAHFDPLSKEQPLKIGIIDTAIDHQHSGFNHASITTKRFVDDNLIEPKAHATAVLGRIIGQGKTVSPLLTHANIYAASVFYQKDAYSQSAPTLALLQALEWMLENDIKVINMSLAGPPNALLEQALQRMREKGVAVVAAAGNAGPASRPLFPAAYTSVIAVSAVDKNQRIYRWGNRGKHIDFVAEGVNVATLSAGNKEGVESGTSMAAPIISAAMAIQMQTQDLEQSLTSLVEMTVDLGDSGRDVIYGDGFLSKKSVLELLLKLESE